MVILTTKILVEVAIRDFTAKIMFSPITILFVAIGPLLCAASGDIDFPETRRVICPSKSSFRYNQNQCTCNDEGTEITCDKTERPRFTPEFHYNQLQNVSIKCLPTRYFEHNCLKCVCDSSGDYATCVNAYGPKEAARYDTPEQCIPGSVFQSECNGCICGDDGRAACTHLNCAAYSQYAQGYVHGIVCIPDFPVYYDLNMCSCAQGGKSINACFRMGYGALNDYPFHFSDQSLQNITALCEPEHSFNYNCRQCYCDVSGEYAICGGNKDCPHKFDFTEIKDTVDDCSPGAIFAKDCNVCVCDGNGKGVCTKLPCDLDHQS